LKIVVCLEYKEHDPRPMRRSFTSSPVLAAQNPKYELINSVEPWNTDGYVF
jgi:hypothetical protein